jgi:hypothetical protein
MSDEWYLKITRVSDGYLLEYPNDAYSRVDNPDVSPLIQSVVADDEDELKGGESLLWRVIDHFELAGDRYDKERLRITREPGDKYVADTVIRDWSHDQREDISA